MKNLKTYIWAMLVQLALVATVQAQNLNFSQYYYTPFLTNPAMVAKDNALQLSVGFRQQQALSGQTFTTPMISAIVPFLQGKNSERRAAVGLSVISDQEGEFLVNQGGMLSLAYNIQVGKMREYPIQLSFGAQGGFFSRRLDLNGLVTNNQISNGVIDNTQALGESFDGNTVNTISFASGLYFHATDTDGLPVFFLGVAGHNINEPTGSFLLGGSDAAVQQSLRVNAVAGYRILRTANFSVTPTVQVENIDEVLLRAGSWFRYHLSAANVGVGVWYNTNGAATASLEYNRSAFFASFSYDLGLSDDNEAWQSGTPEIHLGIRKTFGSNKTRDRDGDGIADKDDACPKLAGTAATNGCPDSDGDGVADKDDVCPNIAGLAKFKGCPDTDGDGVEDKNDECPQVAGIAKFNGCPDTDGDGIKDSEDACPQAAGPVATKGCPDSDNDGVLDKDDRCPQIAGLAALKGCPDKDGDGIADIDDACPDVAGTKALNGCAAISAAKKQRLQKITVEIKDKAFAYRRSEVNPAMYPLLDNMIQELKDHPEVVVKITGHTDHLGEEEFNKTLSLQRAQAVEKYLLDKGIKNKMIVKGEGESQPIAPNNTEAGRRKNRRVDVELDYGNK
ncbi:hypothetical protein BKI52_36750 [marine bacterium AO1-C]|nr:hypothetical protein BKI52_36750 [marine bacterium AO1-C]